MAAAPDVLRTSIALYFPLLVIAWIAYEVVRKKHPTLFAQENVAEVSEADSNRWFAWLLPMFAVSDDDIVAKCGLDAWVFLRFVRMGEKIAGICVGCSLVLFPLYATSGSFFDTYQSGAGFRMSGAPDATGLPDGLPDGPPDASGVDKLSIANVEADDWRLWFSIAVAYVISLSVMAFVKKEYAGYMRRRHDFLSQKDAQQYSVIVTDVPKRLQHPQALKVYMEYLFPNAVHSVYVGVECGHLEQLMAQRTLAKARLDGAQAKLQFSQQQEQEQVKVENEATPCVGERPRYVLSRGYCGKATKEVDAIDYFTEEVHRLDGEIERECQLIARRRSVLDRSSFSGYGSFEQMIAKRRSGPEIDLRLSSGTDSQRDSRPTTSTGGERDSLQPGAMQPGPMRIDCHPALIPTAVRKLISYAMWNPLLAGNIMRNAAFVSFRTLRAAHSAQQLLQTSNPLKMRIHAAPHIKDMMWGNFGLPTKIKSVWALLAACLTFFVVCFWTVPTALVTSMANVQTLQHTYPFWDRAVRNHPWVQNVLEQLAPLLFASMNTLANVIFRILAEKEGHLSVAEVSASLFTKLCYFQVFQMFFVSAVTGSILTQMMAMVDHPKEILFFLGGSIAGQSVLFITFIIVQTCVWLPLVLFRALPLMFDALHHMLAPWYARVPDRQPWMGLSPLNYYPDVEPAFALAQQFLILLLVVVFAPIAPLVGYFGLVFFLCAEVVYRRYYFFVNERKWATVNSTGVFWPTLFYFVLGAVLVAQLTFIGLVALKTVRVLPLLACAALPFCTMLCGWYIVNVCRYPQAAQNLPLDRCCQLDEQRQHDPLTFLDDVYMQPAMAELHATRPQRSRD